MILQNKNAIIYGAGGSLGGDVAKAFAAADARVFLTGSVITVQAFTKENIFLIVSMPIQKLLSQRLDKHKKAEA